MENNEQKSEQQSAKQAASENSKQNSKKGITNLIIVLLLLLLTVNIGITIWDVFFRESGKTALSPDFAPMKDEQYAESYEESDTEKLPQAEGGGSVSLTYSTDVQITLQDDKAKLFFANPGKSNQDMVLQLVIQNEVIAQSGKITPGKKVHTLALLEGAAEKLQYGGYEGEFIVLYYQPDSGEKSIVNTKIPVKITVK